MRASGKVEGEEMAEPKIITKNEDGKWLEEAIGCLHRGGISGYVPDDMCTKDFYSKIVGGHLKVHHVQPGRITSFFSVKSPVVNAFGGVHGGAVGAVAERMAIACARTVVSEDKEIFLAELSISYLCAAPKNSELMVDASVLRSGKSVTVVAIDFKFKQSGKLCYSCHATFFNMPVAKL